MTPKRIDRLDGRIREETVVAKNAWIDWMDIKISAVWDG